MTCIVDYGAGNLRSVQNALDRIGANCRVTADPKVVSQSERIILPGVGHFGQMMSALDRLGLRGALHDRIDAGVPFLGICLGLQALFEGSDEAPEAHGLGVFRGRIERFAASARVPHMGWNTVSFRGHSRLLSESAEDCFYFAHSFFAPVVSATTGICDYGTEFSAILEQDNVVAVQFHPEKSGESGLNSLRRFLLVPENGS